MRERRFIAVSLFLCILKIFVRHAHADKLVVRSELKVPYGDWPHEYLSSLQPATDYLDTAPGWTAGFAGCADRPRQTELFRWFTISIVIAVLREVVSELLFNRMAQIPYNAITLSLAIISVLAGIAVLFELARILFPAASLRNWLLVSTSIIAGSAIAIQLWQPWPPSSEVDVHTQLGVLRLMQHLAVRGQLLVAIVTVLFGLAAIFLTTKGKAFWESHAIKILFGLTTFALTLIVTRVLGEWIAKLANLQPLPHADQERTQAIIDRLIVVPQVTMILVQFWWIRSLWLDEGDAKPAPKGK